MRMLRLLFRSTSNAKFKKKKKPEKKKKKVCILLVSFFFYMFKSFLSKLPAHR